MFANLFCLPLIACGLITMPKRLWAAFKRGRRSRSLFDTPITPALLNSRLSDVLAATQRPLIPVRKRYDLAAFCGLASLSLLTMALPGLLIALAAGHAMSA